MIVALDIFMIRIVRMLNSELYCVMCDDSVDFFCA